MNLVNKNELKDLIGKAGLSRKQIVGLCEYTAGLADMDEKVGEQNFFNVKPIVNFIKRPGGIEVSIMHKFKQHFTALKSEDIKSITIEKGGVIDTEKRSIVGRAILGGLLFGPIGAAIGGVSGMKDKVIKENDNLIIITENGEGEKALLFSIKKGKTNSVYKYFKENYEGVFSMS